MIDNNILNLERIDKEMFVFMNENQIFITVFITLIIVSFKNIAEKTSITSSMMHLIGTLLHELSHYIAILITTLKLPKGFTIWPKTEIENNRKITILGSVSVDEKDINIFNAFIIGMAPISLMYIAYLVSKYFFEYYEMFFKVGTVSYLIYLFLMTILIINAIPTKSDFKMAARKGSMVLYICLISAFYIKFLIK